MSSHNQAEPAVTAGAAEAESRRIELRTVTTRSRLPPLSAQARSHKTQIPSQRVSHGSASTSNTISQYSPSVFDTSLKGPAVASTQGTSKSDIAWSDEDALPLQTYAEIYSTDGYMCMAEPCIQANCYVHVDPLILQEYFVTGTGSSFVSTEDESDIITQDNDDP